LHKLLVIDGFGFLRKVGHHNHLFLLERGVIRMGKDISEPIIKRRKSLQMSKMTDISYNDLFLLYQQECKLKNLADVTIEGYAYAHKQFCAWANKDLKCSNVTQDLINEYILYLKDRLQKPQTVNSYQFKVSPIIKYGTLKGYIKDEIAFTHLVEQDHIKEIYTNEELTAILKRPDTSSFAEFRSWVIVNMLLATGIRATELRELQIQDIDLDGGVLSLRHTKNRKPRLIPIPTSLNIILFEYLNKRKGINIEALFCNIYGEPMQRSTLQTSITKHCKKRGVNKYSLHLFRHTFITLSVRKGMSPVLLKRITGHSNFNILNNYYQFNITDLVNIVDEFNPLEDFKPKQNKFKTK